MEPLIVVLLLLLGLAISGLYAFVNKKMEGLATRSDLEEVQRIVRRVERESHIETAGELFMIERQREAVIHLFPATRKVTDFVLRKNPEKLAEETTVDHHQWTTQLLAVVKEMEEAKANFDLYIDDPQLIERGELIVARAYAYATQVHEDFGRMYKLRCDIRFGGRAERDILSVQFDEMVAQSIRVRGVLQQRVEDAMKSYGDASRRFLKEQTKVN